MDDKNKTQNIIENLLAFSGDGNKSHRSHRRKVSNHLSREFSNEQKEEQERKEKDTIKTNNWMENPYQDLLQSKKSSGQGKKKQIFAHTDKNLKGISNLVQDDDLLNKKESKRKKNSHNNSSTGENVNSYYFYPQKFRKEEQGELPEFGEL